MSFRHKKNKKTVITKTHNIKKSKIKLKSFNNYLTAFLLLMILPKFLALNFRV